MEHASLDDALAQVLDAGRRQVAAQAAAVAGA
jgi:hypothetical protein